MSENQVRKTGTETEKKVRRTRYYYTDYVNHMVRFYLTTPDKLDMDGKKKSDMENWMAVQSVFHFLKNEEKQVLTEIIKAHHRLSDGVRVYCEKTGADMDKIWIMIAKIYATIAKRRGLI